MRHFLWNGRKHYRLDRTRQRYGSATATHAVRAAIQRPKASATALSQTYGINATTVLKRRKRKTVEDQKTGPKAPRSTVLSVEEEAIVVAFRRYIFLPLDDCLYALQPSAPILPGNPCSSLGNHAINQNIDIGKCAAVIGDVDPDGRQSAQSCR